MVRDTTRPGRPGEAEAAPPAPRAAVPGQDRPAGQYLDGWVRDFIAVEAASAAVATAPIMRARP